MRRWVALFLVGVVAGVVVSAVAGYGARRDLEDARARRDLEDTRAEDRRDPRVRDRRLARGLGVDEGVDAVVADRRYAVNASASDVTDSASTRSVLPQMPHSAGRARRSPCSMR
jgi:hypothetical protein